MTNEELKSLGLSPGGCFVNRYEVVRKLGTGGMAVVFLVLDLCLNREPLALKIFSPREVEDSNNMLTRFRNEVLITRILTHPNIVRTYDFAELPNGAVYMTMEFVDGNSLEQQIRDEKESWFHIERACTVLTAIAEGVHEAHEHAVIHRDLKPGNVLISKKGEVKVTDFGLAHSLMIKERLTLTGECVGTPAYMAPEQVLGKPADCRVDVYALGVIAYELATAQPPFLKRGWFDLANQIISEPIPLLSPHNSNIPAWYDDIIQRSTDKDPENRFASAEEFVRALRTRSSSQVLATNSRNFPATDDPPTREMAKFRGSEGKTSPITTPSNPAEGNPLQSSASSGQKPPTWLVATGAALILSGIGFSSYLFNPPPNLQPIQPAHASKNQPGEKTAKKLLPPPSDHQEAAQAQAHQLNLQP